MRIPARTLVLHAQTDNNNLKLWVEVHLEAVFDLVSRPAT